jgi:lipid A disaccharide synthetase
VYGVGSRVGVYGDTMAAGNSDSPFKVKTFNINAPMGTISSFREVFRATNINVFTVSGTQMTSADIIPLIYSSNPTMNEIKVVKSGSETIVSVKSFASSMGDLVINGAIIYGPSTP